MTALERWLRLYCPDLLDSWTSGEATTSASFCRFGVSADGLELKIRLHEGRRYRDILLAVEPSGAIAFDWQQLPEYVEATHTTRPRRQPAPRRETADSWADCEEEEFSDA